MPPLESERSRSRTNQTVGMEAAAPKGRRPENNAGLLDMAKFTDTYRAGRQTSRTDASTTAANAVPAQSSAFNDTRGVCECCGFVSDDALLGVCADCAKERA
jgi:hypothetical protein